MNEREDEAKRSPAARRHEEAAVAWAVAWAMGPFATKEAAQDAARHLARLWINSYDTSVWTHRKGGRYAVTDVAVDESSLEVLIVYFSVDRGGTWVRRLSDWIEVVDGRPRFWRLTASER